MRAAERRKRELQALIEQGWNIVFRARQCARVGPLEIFMCAGRWLHLETGKRGKIGRATMLELIERELTPEERKECCPPEKGRRLLLPLRQANVR